MLIEDTVHSSLDEAPLINASLGITIRGAGLSRAEGGMRGFFSRLVSRYRELGGTLLVGRRVSKISGDPGAYQIVAKRRAYQARQVVSALPIHLTAQLAPNDVRRSVQTHIDRNRDALGGAIVVFLGVPDDEVDEQDFTHHQLLQDYEGQLGNGNNMFISVSSKGDTASAPSCHRAVMISTHCELGPWQKASDREYENQKKEMGECLVRYAQRVYPRLGANAKVYEVATPATYHRFTSRPQGAVGGFRLNLRNANHRSVPHRFSRRGFWQVGDTTWPGLGTVACVLGSRIVADGVLREARRFAPTIVRSRSRAVGGPSLGTASRGCGGQGN